MGENNSELWKMSAQATIHTFASVGATRFVVSWTNSSGDPRRPRSLRNALRHHDCTMPATPENEDWLDAVSIKNISHRELGHVVPALLDAAVAGKLNLIVRPRGDHVWFVQLDDLKAEQVAHIAPAVFLSLETSPGNFQSWVALHEAENPEFTRRLKKGVGGSDKTASGATRVAGSINFKDKYVPNFPRVVIHAAQPGRFTTTDELERLGLVAPPEPVAMRPPQSTPFGRRGRPGPGLRKWPSYERCLEGAPPSQSRPGDTRHSIADFTWCLIAADWGWPVDEIARRLLEESSKARANGPVYALKTATRAAEAARRNDAAESPPPEYGRR